jgi:hypothetical protein
VNQWISVRESDAYVDTGIDLDPRDEYAFVEATGDIWVGVMFTGRNGPQGWDNVTNDPRSPHTKGCTVTGFRCWEGSLDAPTST